MSKSKVDYETKYVYRVWYHPTIDNPIGDEAFFTNRKDAENFSALVNGNMNVWAWEMKIEK